MGLELEVPDPAEEQHWAAYAAAALQWITTTHTPTHAADRAAAYADAMLIVHRKRWAPAERDPIT